VGQGAEGRNSVKILQRKERIERTLQSEEGGSSKRRGSVFGRDRSLGGAGQGPGQEDSFSQKVRQYEARVPDDQQKGCLNLQGGVSAFSRGQNGLGGRCLGKGVGITAVVMR